MNTGIPEFSYAGEDAEHWRWYLRDFEKLGYDVTHYEEEFGHSAQAKDFEDYVMSADTFQLATTTIDNLFNDYRRKETSCFGQSIIC